MINRECLTKITEEKNLITSIGKRLSSFIGHRIRWGALESIIITEKINEKRSRGRS